MGSVEIAMPWPEPRCSSLALAAPAAAQEPQVEVLAEGLNAPRGITIAPDGSIYVAEAGAAGETCMDEACRRHVLRAEWLDRAHRRRRRRTPSSRA